jgi:hypothetical protein
VDSKNQKQTFISCKRIPVTMSEAFQPVDPTVLTTKQPDLRIVTDMEATLLAAEMEAHASAEQPTGMSYAHRLKDPVAMMESRRQQPAPTQEEPTATNQATQESAPKHLRPSTTEEIADDIKAINSALSYVSKGKVEVGIEKGKVPEVLKRDWKSGETADQYAKRVELAKQQMKAMRTELKVEQKATAEREAKEAAEQALKRPLNTSSGLLITTNVSKSKRPKAKPKRPKLLS